MSPSQAHEASHLLKLQNLDLDLDLDSYGASCSMGISLELNQGLALTAIDANNSYTGIPEFVSAEAGLVQARVEMMVGQMEVAIHAEARGSHQDQDHDQDQDQDQGKGCLRCCFSPGSMVDLNYRELMTRGVWPPEGKTNLFWDMSNVQDLEIEIKKDEGSETSYGTLSKISKAFKDANRAHLERRKQLTGSVGDRIPLAASIQLSDRLKISLQGEGGLNFPTNGCAISGTSLPFRMNIFTWGGLFGFWSSPLLGWASTLLDQTGINVYLPPFQVEYGGGCRNLLRIPFYFGLSLPWLLLLFVSLDLVRNCLSYYLSTLIRGESWEESIFWLCGSILSPMLFESISGIKRHTWRIAAHFLYFSHVFDLFMASYPGIFQDKEGPLKLCLHVVHVVHVEGIGALFTGGHSQGVMTYLAESWSVYLSLEYNLQFILVSLPALFILHLNSLLFLVEGGLPKSERTSTSTCSGLDLDLQVDLGHS